eukprot:2859338-Heterocapsa_arctica.AAC.1
MQQGTQTSCGAGERTLCVCGRRHRHVRTVTAPLPLDTWVAHGCTSYVMSQADGRKTALGASLYKQI